MTRRTVNPIPNTITLLNLLSGTIAVIFAFHPSTQYGCRLGWEWSAMMIGLAAVFDFLDGAAARLLHAKSPIGAELDSLADVVSFGVAPALLLVNVLLQMTGSSPSPDGTPEPNSAPWICYTPLFIPMMGALRLAIFNVDTSQTTSFRGLPIPANAIFWIGAVAALYGGLNISQAWIVATVAAISLLMVSRLPMFSLKFSNFGLRDNLPRYIIIAAAIGFVIWLGVTGLALTILLYIAMCIVLMNVRFAGRDTNKG